ncbi:protein sidekick-1-like isoform X2 [Genypterus blacodes]|uniref:protein sidekick-1-like isoform X2 n=1 Tax=Genypterus blacodes TaxID=154954 RepID=UPI003F76D360
MMKMRFRKAQKATVTAAAARDHSAVIPGDQSVLGSVFGEAAPLLLLPAQFWTPEVGSQSRELVSGDRGITGLPHFLTPTHEAPGSVGADASSSPLGLVGSSAQSQESCSSQAQADTGCQDPVPSEHISHTMEPGMRSEDCPERSPVCLGGQDARSKQMTATVATRSGSRGLPLLFLLLLLGSSCHMLHGQEVPPYLQGGVVGQQVVLEGNRLVLTCLAGGSWPLQYRWKVNNSNLTDWSPQYRLSIPSVKRTDAGLYQCMVRNRMGAVIHRRTEVHVAFLGNFLTEEQRRTVTQGRAAVISQPPLDSFPRPVVTWYKDGQKLTRNNRIAITLDNQLVVLATTATDAGRYHIDAVNEMTGEVVTSQAIYLSISVGKKNRGSTDPESEVVAPSIVIGPKETTVVAGNEAILECIANARPLDRLVVSWKRDGRRLAGGRRLIIPAPTSSDMGLYVCEVLLSNATAKPVEARAQLFVMDPPSLSSQPKSKILSELDKNVEIPCLATGMPQPRIEWYKDAVPLSKLANPRYKVTPATGLTVRRVQPGDGGIFQCIARSAAGETQAHTQLLVSSVAPSFTSPPSDQTVTERSVALITCQTSGAPQPAITWRKGSLVLASGSVQVPRFTILQTGGLEVQPVSFQDSGEYTCVASNTEGTINASATLTVWSRTFISVLPSDQRVIKGTTATLKCNATHDARVDVSFHWSRGGVPIVPTGGRVSVRQGSLTIGQTWSGDIGDYTCAVTSQAGNDSHSARLEVIELPHSPRSLAARLNDSDSRSVLLSWLRPFDGNSPLLYYLLELSENNSPWKVYLSEVDPAVTQASVGGLTPARTYQFRLCAVNQVGRGQYSTETQRLMLREEAPSAPPKNVVASGRTNQSIMVQWQPPPEPQLNGILRGYVLRYRLAGLPGDYQEKNISSPETNYCLLKDLIIWTQYQIQVAAYTGAGLGVYSSPVTEYTLQGVPTAPPQAVEVVAINSTTIRFTWNPPPQQFINGINQGYKLLIWPEQSPEDVTIVTITPDYPGSRHTGLVSGLRKFTWYFGSTLCFTTPGDGPRSPPVLLQTHEDTPGPVTQLSFTEILDTSLKVSWAEPEDKNGIITGYVLWWEVSGVNSSRQERSQPNSTLYFLLTGLTSTTLYKLQVAAVTAAGQGTATSATISTGVPPELPGAPSNLVISNISPRTATLAFHPGPNGKTAISRWIVEGQVGKIDGKEEEWKILYQKDNQPDADTLEIPNLTPFTPYRFRMRQVNIVGSSPLSAPSRVIQTLQAAPDTQPSNLTLLSATQTSLHFHWKPLPESQYNSSPETMGYRLRVQRTDGQGEDRTEEVEGTAGGVSEATVENLDPWTKYQAQIQAYNSIGPGPWSSPLTSHTTESVPSGAPVNVTAEAVSSTRILLTWSPLPRSKKNGFILGYKVLYREQDSPDPHSVEVVKGEGSVSLLLGVLEKYTTYELQVLGYTQMGDGPPSSPIILGTKEDVPGPPVRMVFPEVRLTSARVVWQPPTKPNGIILGYQISYRLDSRDPQRWTTVEVGSNARQFTVTGLTSEQTYVFRLTARTAVGWGEEQEALVVTTERRERPQPPRKLSVPQAGVESRQLRLHWVTGSSGSSPMRYFTLQIKELPDGTWNPHTADISHNLTTWTVDRLKPFTSYKLRMLATNDVGDSNLSKETDAVTTLQDVPDQPPVIISVKPTTTTSVLVQWKSPSDDSINGVLIGYRLYYRELHANTSTEAEVQATNNTTSTLITTKSTFKTVSSASLTEFELTQLKKYKRYQIFMTSYNIIGESPPSNPVEVSVGEAAPSVAPQSIRVSAVAPTILEVTWDAPPPETQNGLIQGYKIHYWERDKQNQSEKVKMIFVPDTRVRLTNLTSYTPYLATLSAFNTAGDGPPSDPRGARTLQSAPSHPSYLSFSEVTGGSVNVSWGAPLTPNGQLEGYRVIYQPSAPVQGVSKVVTVDVKGSWQRWLKVRDLTKGVTYNFSVQAQTVSYGPSIYANVTAQPIQGSPGSPLEMSITKTSSALTIHWTEGEKGAAPVTGYVIEARPSDEGVWDSFIRTLPPSSRSVSVPLDRLRSGVSYEFRVIAVNNYGYGHPSTPSAALAALSERPFYEEWWFLVVMALVGLILILVLVFTLLLHGHSTKYKACSSGKNNVSTVEEAVTLDNGGFTALELNSRALNTKNAFLKKNGTRSPPRPSPGVLRYSDEDICNNYNGAVLTESTTLTEKPTEMTDSDYEDEQPKHSFVNHYMSDPTYYNSWKRQPKGLKGISPPFGYEECAAADTEPYYQTVVTQHTTGGAYTPTGQPAHTHVNPNTNPPGSRTPVTGFSSFV